MGIMRDDSIKNIVKEFVMNDSENVGKHVANGSKESSHRVKGDG